MKLLVGLGNPGPSYQFNRHNIGFMAIDAIAKAFHAPPFSLKNGAEISEIRIGSEKLMLLKPQKYMNASGPVVSHFANFYKVTQQDVIVFHDELDVDFGRIKVKIGGGAGGHNGLRSIDAHFANETTRIRIGISHPGHKDLVQGHVLGNFRKEELNDLPYIFSALENNLALLLDGDLNLFRSKLASDLKR